jgi:osmotically-inducible protein OsmY
MSDSNSTIIDQQVRIAFAHHPHLNRHQLEFNRTKGRIVLRGNVDSYFQKQLAQEALRNIDGIEEIENELQVGWR